MSKHGNTVVLRFAASQRIEHILLMVSFSMLCLTGLPQRYSDAGWCRPSWAYSAGCSRLARCTTSLPWY